MMEEEGVATNGPNKEGHGVGMIEETTTTPSLSGAEDSSSPSSSPSLAEEESASTPSLSSSSPNNSQEESVSHQPQEEPESLDHDAAPSCVTTVTAATSPPAPVQNDDDKKEEAIVPSTETSQSQKDPPLADSTVEENHENKPKKDGTVLVPSDAATSGSQPSGEDAAAAPVPKKPRMQQQQPRRRSLRQMNHKLRLPEPGSLQSRRLEELFFQPAGPLRLGKHVLQPVSLEPNIYVLDNFLNTTELQHLTTCIEKGTFCRSFVDGPSSEKGDWANLVDLQHRTSTFLSFLPQQDAKIAAIEQRAASLLGYYSTDKVEPLQLVRYLPGQHFGVHHDLGELADDGTVALPPPVAFQKRRLVTLFVYLNTLTADAGGCTHFPLATPLLDTTSTTGSTATTATTSGRPESEQPSQPVPSSGRENENENGLHVTPVAGRAVLFCNITKAGLPDPRTIHQGEPPLGSHTKYGLNIWLCEE